MNHTFPPSCSATVSAGDSVDVDPEYSWNRIYTDEFEFRPTGCALCLDGSPGPDHVHVLPEGE